MGQLGTGLTACLKILSAAGRTWKRLSSITSKVHMFNLRTLMTDLIDHLVVRTERQPKPNTNLRHLALEAEKQRPHDILTACDRTWTIEQDIPDRSTDREDVPRHVTTAIYSDVTKQTTPGPNVADRLHQSSAAMRPAIEVPHTLSVSQTRCWIMNSPRGSSLSILNHTTV